MTPEVWRVPPCRALLSRLDRPCMSTPAGQKIVVSSPLYPKPLFFPFPPLSVSVAGLPRGARWIERKWCWSGSETECVFMCKCVSIQFQRLQYRVQRFFCSMHSEINPGQSLWCFFFTDAALLIRRHFELMQVNPDPIYSMQLDSRYTPVYHTGLCVFRWIHEWKHEKKI